MLALRDDMNIIDLTLWLGLWLSGLVSEDSAAGVTGEREGDHDGSEVGDDEGD